MKLNVKTLPTYVISLDKDKEKYNRVSDTLTKLNFQNFSRFPAITDTQFRRAIKSHYELLSNPVLKPPFLVLEDDVKYTGHNKFLLDVPDDVDALYLGNSSLAYYHEYTGNFVLYEPVKGNSDIVRIYNMLIAHAVVYISQDYINMVRRVCRYHLDEAPNKAFDLSVAEIQKFFNVYTVDRSIFKQSGHFEQKTDVTISDIGYTRVTFSSVEKALNRMRNLEEEQNANTKAPKLRPLRYNGITMFKPKENSHGPTKNTKIASKQNPHFRGFTKNIKRQNQG